jgi:hypothetical protein
MAKDLDCYDLQLIIEFFLRMSFLIRCVFMDLALSLEGLDLRHSMLFTTIKPVLHVCLAGKFNIKICPL